MRQFNTDDKLRELLGEIEAKQDRLMNNPTNETYIKMIGEGARIKPYPPDGEFKECLTEKELADCMEVLHFGDNTLSKDDIPVLVGFFPSLVSAIGKYSNDTNGLISVFAERIGGLPLERYRERNCEDKKKDIAESIEIAEALIPEVLNISHTLFKARIIDTLLFSISRLESQKERLDFGGFDLFYDEAGQYTDEQRKEMLKTFERRSELPKDSTYRRDFVNQYIDNEVCNRFYSDDYTIKYTPELGEEWDDHFNALCEEYNESEYIRAYTEKDYQGVKCEVLCHYPISCNEAKENNEKIKFARKRGIDPELVTIAIDNIKEMFKETRFKEKEI